MEINDKMWRYIARALKEWFDKTHPDILPGTALKDEIERDAVTKLRKSGALLLRALELACIDLKAEEAPLPIPNAKDVEAWKAMRTRLAKANMGKAVE